MYLDMGLCGMGQESRLPAAPQAQESKEGVGCFGNLPTTCETSSEEAASPHACSMHHVPNGPILRAVQSRFQLSEACWKSIQTGFKSNTKTSSKYKSTLRERISYTVKERKFRSDAGKTDTVPHLILCSYNSPVLGATCAAEK